jgi:predicted outer membrane repeat protein
MSFKFSMFRALANLGVAAFTLSASPAARAQTTGPFAIALTSVHNGDLVDCTSLDAKGTYQIPDLSRAYQVLVNGTNAGLPKYGSFQNLKMQTPTEGSWTIRAEIYDRSKLPMTLKASSVVTVNCLKSYSIDATNHIIQVTGRVGSLPVTIPTVVQFLNQRPDKSVRWTVRFDNQADYLVKQTVIFDELRNVSLWSDLLHPANFKKDPAALATTEYLWRCLHCEDVTIEGFRFEGVTGVADANGDIAIPFDPFAPNWADQGVFLPSTHRVTVLHNGFYNIGNGALRVTTYWADPIDATHPAINCLDNVVQENLFKNIYQVTTTSDGPANHIHHGHGGCRNLNVIGNTFRNIHGGLKFASRVGDTLHVPATQNAGHVLVSNNKFYGSEHLALDISGYSDIEISDNYFQDIAHNIASIYTNYNADNAFQWGDDIRFLRNTAVNIGGGIYFGNSAYPANNAPYTNGEQFVANRFRFENNVLTGVVQNVEVPEVKDGQKVWTKMQENLFSGSNINGMSFQNNQISQMALPKYMFTLPSSITNVTIAGNTLDGVRF